ncbi:J domain-containing protein [Verrucosispora sp. NA02020]|uniref:J domain-containing protein n=1 Tax=Verrucosispora sp. NA02020 TaxID=2742132 RepID=UPI003D74A8B6
MRTGEYMLSDGQDPYLLLGVTKDSTPTQIRERYRILVQVWHPDRHQSSPENVRAEATRQMQQINAAYKLLLDSHGRDTSEHRTGGGGQSWAGGEQSRTAERETFEQEQERRKRERDAYERQAQERDARRRATAEREARQRAAEEREARERETREKERQEREREARERQHPSARWTHPSYDPVELPESLVIRPITVSLPNGEEGYTLRAYADEQKEQAVFPGADGHLLLFRSQESLHRYLTEPGAHELATAPGWDDFMNWVLRTGMRDDDEEQSYDFDLIVYNLRFPIAQWVPRLFITHRDLVMEVAEAFEWDDVRTLLRVGSPLDRLDDLMRVADRPLTGWKARRQLGSFPSGPVNTAWRQVIRLVGAHVRWLR